jgi:uncharacterized repeat protein (TIGR03803 family)
VIYSFPGALDAGPPNGDLIFDGAGNLYGTTQGGGFSGNAGTVFKLSPNSDGTWTETVIYIFTGQELEGTPEAGVIVDAAGNLYGTTYYGGSLGSGAVFKLSPNSDGTWTKTVIYSSSPSGGYGPAGKLTFDAAGNLYGTMSQGGLDNYGGSGSVFKLSPDSNGTWTYSVLYVFKGGRDGGLPRTGVIFDAAGNLYGTTVYGGYPLCIAPTYCGKVFKLTPHSDGRWTESNIHVFSTAAGGPSITFDATGNLYGTTLDGGFGDYGRVYKLMPQSGGGWAYTVPRYFYGEPAAVPVGDLIRDKAGNLYGAAQCVNGYNCYGVIYEITP